jgi:predicted nucleic acid-binding protein
VGEFASHVSRDVRMGELSAAEGSGILEEFDATISTSFVMLVPNSYDFDLAQEYVANFATHLRAPDALHLAVAHNNGVEFIATLDEGMLAAAKRLKVPARRVIR